MEVLLLLHLVASRSLHIRKMVCSDSRRLPMSNMEPRRCRIHVRGGRCVCGRLVLDRGGVDVAHILDLSGVDVQGLRSILAQVHGDVLALAQVRGGVLELAQVRGGVLELDHDEVLVLRGEVLHRRDHLSHCGLDCLRDPLDDR